MERIYVECKPDKALVKKLGFTQKEIYDAGDKSRVYYRLQKGRNLIAIVDEDPNPTTTISMYPYEKRLERVSEQYGMVLFCDISRNNKIIVLKGMLENWLIQVCKSEKIDITKFGLSNKCSQLHDEINRRLPAYEKLLDHLLENENKALLKLKEWLQ